MVEEEEEAEGMGGMAGAEAKEEVEGIWAMAREGAEVETG